MKNIKGAIFDLDGTILDSMYVWRTLGEEYLKRKGVVPPLDLRSILKPLSMLEAAQYFRRELGVTDTEKSIIDEINGMIYEQYEKKVQLKPFVLDAIKKLIDNGVKLCVATATDRFLVEVALNRLNILSYFNFILTCSEVGESKNNALIYREALSKLDTNKNETLIFEDAIYAIKTATEAGFRVYGIHDKSFDNSIDEIKNLTERFLYSWEEF